MSWAARGRLLLGLIVVVLIVGACTIVFNQRQNAAHSSSAAIEAERFDIGAAYAGTVEEQLVDAGDDVAAGDVLFVVSSPQLARDIDAEVVDPGELVGVGADGTYEIVSPVAGTVAVVHSPVGDFVPGGTAIAAVDRSGSMTVAAQFLLTARDYGRIAPGTAVDLLLPDDRELTGRVDQIEVVTVDGQAASTITVTSTDLENAAIAGLYRPGTPVTATLHLRDDGPLAGVSDAVRDLLLRMGL